MITKMALAVDERNYPDLYLAHHKIFDQADYVEEISTIDNTYVVVAWEYPFFEIWELNPLRSDLASIKHSFILISDERIVTDVSVSDKTGSDEEFNELLGWKADICLWQDDTCVIPEKNNNQDIS